MVRLSLITFVVAIAVVAPNIPQCQAFWKELLFDKAKDVLFEEGDTEVLGYICNFRVQPRFRSFELYFRGDVWCPGWTSIKGESLTRSRTSVVNKAIADFAQKAVKDGLITQEEAAPLL